MANVKSTEMVALLAAPLGLRPAIPQQDWEAQVRYKKVHVPVAAADADGTIYVVARFKSSDRILRMLLSNTAITGGVDYDCGIYVAGTWASDAAAKDADIIFDGVDMSAARDALTDLVGSGTNAINAADFAKALWQWAGDADEPEPQTFYDVCFTANVVGTAAGTIRVEFLYTSYDEMEG